MRFLLGAAALVVIAAGLRATAVLLVPLVLAVFLSVVTFPLVAALQERRVPRALAVLMTMLAVLVILSGPSVVIVTAIRQFASRVPDYEQRLKGVVSRSFEWLRTQDIDTSSLIAFVDPGQVLNLMMTMLSGMATLLSLVLLLPGITQWRRAFRRSCDGRRSFGFRSRLYRFGGRRLHRRRPAPAFIP